MFYTNQYDQQISNENNEIDSNPKKISRPPPPIKPNKQLPEKAIHLMNAWYLAHDDNPYPNRNDLDYLATNGGIKESQVKAWFSNKRNRTQNTHPKRAKRYFNRTQLQSSWTEPSKIHLADEFEQRAHVLQQSTSSPNWSYVPSQSYDYQYYYSQ